MLRDDNRGQAIGIARLFLGLGVGAVMLFIIGAVTAPLFTHVKGQTDPGSMGATGTMYLQQGIEGLALAFLLISFFGIVAYAVFSREVLR